MMGKTFDLPFGFDIRIEKHIPLAGGMAGGSTDAAAVIRGINKLCNLGKSIEELMALGVTLGADIPFCIQEKPALAEGIGEKLTTITGLSSDTYILLVNPMVSISTKEIYNLIDTKKCYNSVDNISLIKALKDGDLKSASTNMKNVMQMVTSELCPEINTIIESLNKNGAVAALMSGSGATCYGIFTDREAAEFAQKAFVNTNYFTKISNPIE
jgi:4-diphosphocytidyl-2-C-methyl-D-erythritol kinase